MFSVGVDFPALKVRRHFFANIDRGPYSVVWETVKTRPKTMERLMEDKSRAAHPPGTSLCLYTALLAHRVQQQPCLKKERCLADTNVLCTGSLCINWLHLAASHHTWSLHQSPEAGSQNTHSFKSFLVSFLSKNYETLVYPFFVWKEQTISTECWLLFCGCCQWRNNTLYNQSNDAHCKCCFVSPVSWSSDSFLINLSRFLQKTATFPGLQFLLYWLKMSVFWLRK